MRRATLALMFAAAQEGQLDVVKQLAVEGSVDVALTEDEGEMLLFVAAFEGRLGAVDSLARGEGRHQHGVEHGVHVALQRRPGGTS